MFKLDAPRLCDKLWEKKSTMPPFKRNIFFKMIWEIQFQIIWFSPIMMCLNYLLLYGHCIS